MSEPPSLAFAPPPEAQAPVTPAAPGQDGGQGAAPARPRGLTPPSRRGGSGRQLVDVLVSLQFITAEAARDAHERARAASTTVERLLMDSGEISSDQLARAVAERYGLDYLDLGIFAVDPVAMRLLTAGAARRYGAVPVAYLDPRTLLLAIADPANVLAVDDIALMTGLDVRPAVASAEDITALITGMNRFNDAVQEAVDEAESEREPEALELRENNEEAPVIKLVHSVVAQATERGASDIHFEPQPNRNGSGAGDMRVRMRVDGVLVEAASVPRHLIGGVISRIKIMAELDIAERRVPQDGRVGITLEGRHVDLRVVTMPAVHGESIVMRILDKESIRLELSRLGFRDEELDRFRRGFNRAHGAVLVTGPTGSGKSTSLYGALAELNTPEKNIITIEDPVEYQIEGITQVQVNPKAGLSFAAGLRAMMRADPDVLMVGEIRDRETAQIAIEGALTGHMVLSTLHTNDAPSAITRLVEMGVEPFLLASALETVVAQRLARMLCQHCKRAVTVPAASLQAHGYGVSADIQAWEPAGCPRCGGMGFRGRVGLYEVMTMTEEIRDLTLARASADQLATVAVKDGMRRLREDGLAKVMAGVTSLSEIARVCGS
jgi:type IV pilus assembly protein PilB